MWLSNNNVEILYELATPYTETVDPISIPFTENKINIYCINNSLNSTLSCMYNGTYTGRVDELGDIITDKDLSENVDNLNARIDAAESVIEQLSNMISHLVTDANGESLMTQTSDGWTFNMSDINGNLNAIKDAMLNMKNDQGESNSALEKLAGLVNDVANKTAYITMARDENGDPCIELGKTDSSFKVRITNKTIDFLEGSARIAYASNNTFYSETIIVKKNLQIGEGPGFTWSTRGNGNCGLIYIPAEGEINSEDWNRYFNIKYHSDIQVVNDNPKITFNVPMGETISVNLSSEDQVNMKTCTVLNPGDAIFMALRMDGDFENLCSINFYVDGEIEPTNEDLLEGVRVYSFENKSTTTKTINGINCTLYGNVDSDYNMELTIDSIYILSSGSMNEPYLWNEYFKIQTFDNTSVINNNPTLTFSGTSMENNFAFLNEENLSFNNRSDIFNYEPSIVLKSGETYRLVIKPIEATNLELYNAYLLIGVNRVSTSTIYQQRLGNGYSSIADEKCIGLYIHNNTDEDMEISGPCINMTPLDDTGYSLKIEILKIEIS